MTSGAHGPDKHVETHWQKVSDEFISARERSEIMSEYVVGDRPLSMLDEPRAFGPLEAQHKSLSNLVAVFKEQHPTEEKLSVMKRMSRGLNRAAEFVRKHPWLSAGMVVAILLFIATSYLTVSALMGHTSIAIFHAHPEIGAGIAFMTLYYGVYLLNMSRRAALKDDLEKRIEAHNEFKNKLISRRELNIQEIVEDMNDEIGETNRSLQLIQKEMHLAHQEVKLQYDKANAVLNRVKEYQQTLITLLRENLPTAQKEDVMEALERASAAVRSGGDTLVFPEMETELPLVPVMKIVSEHIEIPDTVTENMEENARKARSMGQKFKGLFTGMNKFMSENPGSASLVISGLAMCVLAGVASYFWLHGMSNMYFFGSLSAMTIAPMFIYGLSMVYEGYNSGVINDLRRQLNRIDEDNEKRNEALDQERERLNKIARQARGTFQQFTKSWQEFHQVESEKHKLALEGLRERDVSMWQHAEGFCEAIIRSLLRIYPEIEPVEARRVLSEPAKGAVIAGTAHRDTPSPPEQKFSQYV